MSSVVALPPPDVSFVVAAYNAAQFIEATIHSALNQTDVSVEVVVADDASKDDTVAIVTAIASSDPRVRVLALRENAGPSKARNAAIAAARGRWIAILDADDILLPTRSRQLIDLAEMTSSDVVGDNFARFSENPDHPYSTMLPVMSRPYYFFVDAADFLRGNLMFGKRANLGYIKLMFQHEFLKKHAVMHREDIRIGEDFLLGLDCLLKGARMVVSSEPLYRYRVRAGSLSHRSTAEHIDQLIEAHDAADFSQALPGCKDLTQAADEYRNALVRARATAAIIAKAKARAWGKAVRSLVSEPSTWPLVMRFAGEAAMKRMKFR